MFNRYLLTLGCASRRRLANVCILPHVLGPTVSTVFDRLSLQRFRSGSSGTFTARFTLLFPDTQDAQVNSMTARLPNANTKMFLLHAFYGLGATISPLVSTEFVKREADRVYLYFAVSLGFAAVTVTLLLVVFRLRTEDQVVGRRASQPDDIASPDEKNMQQGGEPVLAREPEVEVRKQVEGSGNKMKRIMKTPAAHFMAFYLCVYVNTPCGGDGVSADSRLVWKSPSEDGS